MDSIDRGDLFWVVPPGIASRSGVAHPHVVLQETELNRSRLPTVVVCSLTTNLKRVSEPGNVLLEAGEGGLEKASVVVVSLVSAVAKADLGERIGALSPQRVEEILAGMRLQQGLAHGPAKWGKLLFLHGASSSGKSTLAAALQDALPEPYWHYSIDHLLAAGIVPRGEGRSPAFQWTAQRPGFFEGFHRTLPVLLEAGNNLILEHIIEDERALERLGGLLHPFDVLFVGVHCDLAVLEERERRRGDRRLGSAREDALGIHQRCVYDREVDTTSGIDAALRAVLDLVANPPAQRALGRPEPRPKTSVRRTFGPF